MKKIFFVSTRLRIAGSWLISLQTAYPDLSDDYWTWVAQLYGPDMIERFGGFNIVDDGQLPIGMVNLFREGKVKWQG